MTDHETVDIRIQLPLPMSVAAALANAIGATWPAAMIRADQRDFVMQIPNAKPKRVAKRTLREILAEATRNDGESSDAWLQRWTEHGPDIALDHEDEAWQKLATWALVVLTSSAAPDYVCQTLTAREPDGTERQFAITVAWSKSQLPDQENPWTPTSTSATPPWPSTSAPTATPVPPPSSTPCSQ